MLFAQERLGRSGRRFKMLKFRTMHPNASTLLHDVLTADPEAREGWDAFQKLRVDPRVTRAGKWLRRASLDELPQLINVLRRHEPGRPTSHSRGRGGAIR